MTNENKFKNTKIYNRPKKRKNKFTIEQENILKKIFSKISGFVIILFSIFLIFSFFSYIFHYQNDQIFVEAFFNKNHFDSLQKIKNWGGLYGAVISYLFIYKYFGLISSLIISFLIFIFGTKLSRLKYFSKYHTWKFYSLSLYLIFIINSFIGIFFSKNYYFENFTGFLSDVITQTLMNYFGFGSYFIILASIILFLFFCLKFKFKKINKIENEKKEEKQNDIVDIDEKN